MKKELFSIAIVAVAATMISCGNKTKSAASVADSTVVNEVSEVSEVSEESTETNNMEAVISQVNAVYDYWNELREHYDENKPTMEERFGTKEWQQVYKEVRAIDLECECGGFFDFGDEGPLDAWTYDCYEGTVSANDIKVELLTDSTADVRFLVKDAATIKGVPLRWQMRFEDGQWRVANIIFVNDDNYDILMGMRAYIDYNRKEK